VSSRHSSRSRDGYVFCIVGLCPTQLVCKAPGRPPETTLQVAADRHQKKPTERDLGELTRDRATPHHLMKRGWDLRPQKRRRNEVIASHKVEALLRKGRLARNLLPSIEESKANFYVHKEANQVARNAGPTW